MSEELTTLQRNRIGTIKISKGTRQTKGEVKLFSWDAVGQCTDDRCPAYELCSYEKKARCSVQLSYLKTISTIIMTNYPDLEEPTLYRIGMHLIPLYKNLCKMKIEELGVVSAVTLNARGTLSMNPLYREIREHIKLIESLWRSVGLVSPDTPEVGFGIGVQEAKHIKKGDPSYYDSLVKQEEEDEKA